MSRRLIDVDDLLCDLGYDPKRADWVLPNSTFDIVLKAPTIDAVPLEVWKQTAWERDIAIGQLEEHGITFGCIAPDVVKIVRCAECVKRKLNTNTGLFKCEPCKYKCNDDQWFCPEGERW